MKQPTPIQITRFNSRVLDWFQSNGRKHLPWQKPATPYRVWISEVMLQQTQVDTVIPYFENFIATFPTIKSLAKADINEVLHLWSGLGYYARARNLHKTAQLLVDNNKYQLPNSVSELENLAGIGRSTAGAIRSLGFNQTAAILDGNVKRVLARHYQVPGWPSKSSVSKQLWKLSEALTPDDDSGSYNQAMMDIGSLLCRRSNPDCKNCPISTSCQSYVNNEIDQFPGKKPKTTRPVRKQHFLLISNHHNQVLLHQRPPVGIWGGLWCLPDSNELNSSDFDSTNIKQFSKFIHQFSHFTLDATVSTAKNNFTDEVMDASNWSWYDLNNPEKVGMPAPLIKVLTEFKESQK